MSYKKIKLFDNPFKEYLEPSYTGAKRVQRIYKFDNGYGASVARIKGNNNLGLRNGYYTLTSNEKVLPFVRFLSNTLCKRVCLSTSK